MTMPEGPRDGDRWETRLTDDGYRAVVTASNDWPPPGWTTCVFATGPLLPLQSPSRPPMLGIVKAPPGIDPRRFRFEWERLHWLPPAKGTHEEDLTGIRFGGYILRGGYTVRNGQGVPMGGVMEAIRAQAWSRTTEETE